MRTRTARCAPDPRRRRRRRVRSHTSVIIALGAADVVRVGVGRAEQLQRPRSVESAARRRSSSRAAGRARAVRRDAARTRPRVRARRCAKDDLVLAAIAAEENRAALRLLAQQCLGEADQRRDPDAARDEHDLRARRRGRRKRELARRVRRDQRVARPDAVVKVPGDEPSAMRLTVIAGRSPESGRRRERIAAAVRHPPISTSSVRCCPASYTRGRAVSGRLEHERPGRRRFIERLRRREARAVPRAARPCPSGRSACGARTSGPARRTMLGRRRRPWT